MTEMVGTPFQLRQVRKNHHASFARYAAAFALALIVVAALIVGERIRLLAKATDMLLAIDQHRPFLPLTLYIRYFTDKVDVQDVTIPGRSGPIPARIYSPRHSHQAPTMLMLHGMTSNGFMDPNAVRFATSMASTGFQVITPQIVGEQQFLMRAYDIPRIDDVIQWAALRSGHRVSLVGFSFSAGLAVSAASQPGYAQDVKSVLAISGYDDIDRLGRYYLHQGAAGPDGQVENVTPLPVGLLLMAIQHMDEMVPEKDAPVMSRISMDFITGRSTEGLNELAQLTPAQQKLFQDLNSAATPEMKQRYELLLQRHAEELAAISPHTQIKGLQAALFVVHGREDFIIPATEAAWLINDAPKDVPSHLFLSGWMNHARVGGRAVLYEKLQMARFFSDFLYSTGLR